MLTHGGANQHLTLAVDDVGGQGLYLAFPIPKADLNLSSCTLLCLTFATVESLREYSPSGTWQGVPVGALSAGISTVAQVLVTRHRSVRYVCSGGATA